MVLNSPRLFSLDEDKTFYCSLAQSKKGQTKRMRGWGKGISSSSHCFEVFTIHRQDVSQTATVAVIVEITLCVYVLLDITAAGKSVVSVVAQNHNISWLSSYQSMSFLSQTGSCKHSVRCRTSAVSTSATAPAFAVVVLNSGLFVSVSAGCLMQLCFCDGWLQCFSNQEWGPGLFPVGVHMGGALICLSYPALPWLTYRELNP